MSVKMPCNRQMFDSMHELHMLEVEDELLMLSEVCDIIEEKKQPVMPYPDGTQSIAKESCEIMCPYCGHTHIVDGTTDLGHWEPNAFQDLVCTNCQESYFP